MVGRRRIRRVLHVFGALGVGGAETWLYQALRSIPPLSWRHEFCLLDSAEGAFAKRFRSEGYKVFHCPFEPAATFPMRFHRLLKNEHYDVVHSHVLLFSGAALSIARAAATPVRIAHLHNGSDGRPDSLPRRAYRESMRRLIGWNATATLACSPAAAELVGGEARLLPYGIDLERFRTRPDRQFRRRYGFAPSDVVLGHLGRLTAQKNQSFLLDAFALALSQRPQLRLAVAGEGPLESALETHAARLGVADRVHLLGVVDDAPELLTNVFDAFALPSLHEGLPLALLEAQAAGLPCLISDRISDKAIAIPELVRRKSLDDSLESWAEGLCAIPGRGRLAPPAAVARLRQAGFDAERSAADLFALYERLCSGCRPFGDTIPSTASEAA